MFILQKCSCPCHQLMVYPTHYNAIVGFAKRNIERDGSESKLWETCTRHIAYKLMETQNRKIIYNENWFERHQKWCSCARRIFMLCYMCMTCGWWKIVRTSDKNVFVFVRKDSKTDNVKCGWKALIVIEVTMCYQILYLQLNKRTYI